MIPYISPLLLYKLCGTCAVTSFGIVALIKYKAIIDAKNAQCNKDALKALRQNKGATILLGEPIEGGNVSQNKGEDKESENMIALQRPVTGTKAKGQMYYWIKVDEGKEQSTVKRIELALENETFRRLLIQKES